MADYSLVFRLEGKVPSGLASYLVEYIMDSTEYASHSVGSTVTVELPGAPTDAEIAEAVEMLSERVQAYFGRSKPTCTVVHDRWNSMFTRVDWRHAEEEVEIERWSDV